jgi:hypothetical protein
MTVVEAKRSVEETEPVCNIESEAKKARPSEIDLVALRKQVEYYLSDANLKHDKFFHTKISSNEEGWLALEHILACNKIKLLTVNAKDIVESLAGSSLLETNEAGDSIRRKDPLPNFEGENKRSSKGTSDKHPALHKRQITLGEFKFPNLIAAKKRVGEILKSRKAGLLFKEGTPDYNLVVAVMSLHPNASNKMEGMSGIKVDLSPQGDSRCFYVVKGESKDQFEDISIVKAFNNFESKLLADAESTSSLKEVASASPEDKKESDAPVSGEVSA